MTEKEKEVLAFIYGYFEDNNCSPTMQEIADRFEFSKTRAIGIVNHLQDKRKVVNTGKPRGLILADREKEVEDTLEFLQENVSEKVFEKINYLIKIL
jgi:Mn-dependent DtxR family transcriptional regulator